MHGRHCFLFLTILLSFWGFSVQAFDVRDFGAVGDGVADDTAAIQTAINQCVEAETFCLAGHSWLPPWGGHGGHGGGGEVFFPAGTYRITRPLVYQKRRITFRGEPGATIVAEQSHDIFYLGAAFRIVFENLRFVGGRIQLNFFTNNGDMAMLRMENCTFENASLENIRAFNLKAEDEWRGIPPYLVDWADPVRPVLAVNPEAEATTALFPNSTLFAILNCKFQGANTFVNGGSDVMVIEDTEFERTGGQAVPFCTTTNLNLVRVKARFTGTAEEAKACRAWFDVEGEVGALNGVDLSMDDCEFVNAEGCATPLLRSRGMPSYKNNTIRIRNSRFDLQGGPLVRYKAGTLSGILAVEGNENLSATPLKAVDFEHIPTLEDIETKIRYQPYNELPLATQLKWRIADNQGFDETAPEVFAPFLHEPLPVADVTASSVARAEFQEEFAGKTLRPEFTDGVAVEEALRAVFAQAEPGDRVVLPGRRFDVSEAILVPGGVEVVAEGTALFWSVEPELACFFRTEGAGDLIFRNLAFYGGATAVNLAAPGGTAVFKNCGFLNQSLTAIHAMNSPEKLLVADSVFFSCGGVQTNAAHSEIRRNWVCNCPQMDERGFFVCHGGEMLAEYNLFVPILPRVNIGTFRPEEHSQNLPNGNNLRWFDGNDARLHLNANRIGGEFNGMTPVYLSGESSSLLFEGAYCWFGNAYTRHCMVYCRDLPRAILLRDIVFNAENLARGVPYNIMVRDKATGRDLPAQVLPCAQATCITMYDDIVP
ncbi:MAG: hypothetical protein IKS83_06660 [Victivallales bacterium]|nr:hypothetical protein [Victivallales bacterium]